MILVVIAVLMMLIFYPDREVVCHATAWDFYDGKVTL